MWTNGHDNYLPLSSIHVVLTQWLITDAQQSPSFYVESVPLIAWQRAPAFCKQKASNLSGFTREKPDTCSVCVLSLFTRPILCDPMDYSPTRLLCAWDSPGKNAGVGCHALLQGILLIQGLNLYLLHLLPWKAGSLPLVPDVQYLILHTTSGKLINLL